MNSKRFTELLSSGDSELFCHAVQEEIDDLATSDSVDSLPLEIRPVYTIEKYFGLTVGGGYESLFMGAFQGIIRFVVDDLSRIGLVSYIDGLRRLIDQVFPDGIPLCSSEFDDLVDSYMEQFDESPHNEDEGPFDWAEKYFWEEHLKDEMDFRRKMVEYIAENRDLFVSE